MSILDQYPDCIRKIILTDPKVRFLYDECVMVHHNLDVFYRELAIYLATNHQDIR